MHCCPQVVRFINRELCSNRSPGMAAERSAGAIHADGSTHEACIETEVNRLNKCYKLKLDDAKPSQHQAKLNLM